MIASLSRLNSHQESFAIAFLYLVSTRVTPYFLLDQKKQYQIIPWRFCLSDSQKICNQTDCAFTVYSKDGEARLIAYYSLGYLNTSYAKCLFKFFREFKELEKINTDIKINWYYNEGIE